MSKWRFFPHPSILQIDCSKYLFKRQFRFRLQISKNFGTAPPSPAPQHWNKNKDAGQWAFIENEGLKKR